MNIGIVEIKIFWLKHFLFNIRSVNFGTYQRSEMILFDLYEVILVNRTKEKLISCSNTEMSKMES